MTIANAAYVTAEMACSHERDRALAQTIIDVAEHAGGDACNSKAEVMIGKRIRFWLWTPPMLRRDGRTLSPAGEQTTSS
jgi:hypothetical protein